MKRRGIFVAEGCFEELKKKANGISCSLLIENILSKEIREYSCKELKKRTTTINISESLYRKIEEEAKKCGVTPGHLIKYLLQRWYLREVVYARQELEKV